VQSLFLEGGTIFEIFGITIEDKLIERKAFQFERLMSSSRTQC
jgi:hypothetical protein